MTARNEAEAHQHLSAAAEAQDAERARWVMVLGGRAAGKCPYVAGMAPPRDERRTGEGYIHHDR
jgi:hypothetical protein